MEGNVSNSPMPRTPPRDVLYAVWLQWSTLFIGVLRLTINFPYIPKNLSLPTIITIIAVVLLVLAVLYWWVLGALIRGRNWARMTLLILFALWVPFAYGQFTMAFTRSSMDGAALAFQELLDLASLILVFRRSSRHWFRASFDVPSVGT